MKKTLKKYGRSVLVQFIFSIISMGVCFIVSYSYSHLPLLYIFEYSISAFILSLIILLPAFTQDFMDDIIKLWNNKKKKKSKIEKKKSEPDLDWKEINFTDVKYVTSFIIIVFLTAFITKLGSEAASLFITFIKLFATNSENLYNYEMIFFIVIAMCLPSIIPFMIYYCKACSFLFTKYTSYKEMIGK